MTWIAGIMGAISGLKRIMPLLAGCATAAAAMRQQPRTFYSSSSLDEWMRQDIGLAPRMLLSASGIHPGRDSSNDSYGRRS